MAGPKPAANGALGTLLGFLHQRLGQCKEEGLVGCVCAAVGGFSATTATGFFARRSDHHDHLAAFQARELLYQNGIGQIIAQAVEQSQA